MLLSAFIRDGIARLEALYPSREARALVLRLCEDRLGVRSYTHIVEPQTEIPAERETELMQDLQRLCAGEPIQYVLGEAEFCGRRFSVGPGVLIPRPETELLVAEGVRALREMATCRPPLVLDLCTGSGCIAWSVALEIRDAQVFGVDLSGTALRYASSQFPPGGPAPVFLQADLLDDGWDLPAGPFDLLLSNPPYICRRERAQMRPNVLAYEPDEALFVPDEDPLLFYRAIARRALRHLRPGGAGLVEINETLGAETAAVFGAAGLKNIRILPDLFGKERMIRFEKSR